MPFDFLIFPSIGSMSDEKEEKVDEKALLAEVQAKKDEVQSAVSRFVPI